MSLKLKKILFSNWLICTILTLLVIGGMLLEFHPMQFLEYKAYDFLTRLRKREISSQVVLVKIDEKSIKEIGCWPWPRSYIAEVISRLSRFSPKAFGLHLLYPSQEINPGLKEIINIRGRFKNEPFLRSRKSRLKIDRFLAKSQKRLEHDNKFTAAVNHAVNIVLPLRFNTGPVNDDDGSELPGILIINSLDFSKNKVSPAQHPYAFDGDIIVANQVTATFDQLARKAGALGHINQTIDSDFEVRRSPLFIKYKERYFPSIGLQLAAKYVGVGINEIIPIDDGLRLKNLEIPTDGYFQMFIDYGGKGQKITSYSFSDVYHGKVPEKAFNDKIVLLGVTSRDFVPLFKTTANSDASKVEICANVVENIINRKHFSRPAWGFAMETMVVLYFGLFLIFVIPKVNPRDGGLILSIFLLTWIGFTVVLFMVFGYWLKVLSPIFLAFIGFFITGYKRFAEEKQRESMELNKMLGLSFQKKGVLDFAFEKFSCCPVENKEVRSLLYDLGLDFERKRMFKKALDVYNHMLKAGKFKDITKRIKALESFGETAIFSPGSTMQEETLLINGATTKPTLGRYEIIKELGQGAMGTVYLGMDPKINREVAIKTLKYADVDADKLAEVKTRFFREAEAAGKLSHTKIVTIFDVGEEYDMAYMAMEFLKGKDLSEYCSKNKLLRPKQVLKVVLSVAEALDYAHRNGVVHRDIKPDNIILLQNNRVKVADFGIARVMTASKTQTGVILGTPNYMSPEQVAGAKLDGRSDLFSLGVVLYELLTGEKPFKGDNLTNLMYAISNVSYIPLSKIKPNLPSCLEAIITKSLTKSAKKRFKSAAEMGKKVRLCLNIINKQ
ncbi:MAG: serine/threonine-protein kinase [Thermodesulfobacteriota bacterium]|nr:serine/threonine-protein kinase [Thermodesulfobacteriota bacterium]